MISETQLVERLQALSVPWSEEVDITEPVMAEIHAPRRRLPGFELRRAAAVGFAVVVATAVTVLVFVPGARTAVARLLGFPGIAVEQSTGPLPELTGIDLGHAVSLEEAARRTGASVRTLPQPAERVHFDEQTGAVHLVYRLDDGRVVLLTQLRGAEDPLFLKQAPGVVPTQVDGQFALWVSGPDHAVLRIGGATDEARLSQNALLWSAGEATYRLEIDGELPEAVRLAERLR